MSVSGVSNSNNYDNQYQSNESQNTEQVQSESAGEASSASSAGETDSAGETSSTSSTSSSRKVEDGEELLAGKSTQKGNCDYFTGKSVITDPDTVIDIARIMDKHHASNMKPETLAGYLREEGYNVEVVKMGNRYAIQFENGDFFYDSDGDGNLGTKDVNMQLALTMVEQQYGVDLTALKNSRYTAIYMGHEGDDGGVGMLDGADALKDADKDGKKASSETLAILDDLDDELQAAGYRGERSAYELWADNDLSSTLFQYGIEEPSLPDAGDKTFESAMSLFGAALSIAANAAANAEAEQAKAAAQQ